MSERERDRENMDVDIEFEERKTELKQAVAHGNWLKVINLYKTNADMRDCKINRSGDTAIHFVIANGHQWVAEELVCLAGRKNLQIANEVGNTPLHIAASTGNKLMCELLPIIGGSHLMKARNHDGETPIFLAVSHGKTQAFLCLLTLDRSANIDSGFLRRNNGDSILLSAVLHEYFGHALKPRYMLRMFQKDFFQRLELSIITTLFKFLQKAGGLPTNIDSLFKLANHEAFENGEVETHFIKLHKDDLFVDPNDLLSTQLVYNSAVHGAAFAAACVCEKEHVV